jgi:hypothetical protein
MPAGLKDLIINHGFTLDLLQCIQPSDLAEDLGIDKDVAKLICDAARRLMRADMFETKVTTEP